MGGGPSLALQLADSPTEPGQPCILSEAIELDYDAFLDEVLELVKYPVPPRVEPVLKECTVTDGTKPGEFTVKVVLDGVKLTKYGHGNKEEPNKDRVMTLNNYTYSRAERYLNVDEFEPHWVGEKGDTLKVHTHTKFLQDPLRVEHWLVTPAGERVAIPHVIPGLQHFLNAVVAALVERKVPVTLDKAKGSVTSDAIPESVVTFEPLLNGLVAALKEMQKPVVEEVSETKFKLKSADGQGPDREVTVDKEAGRIASELRTQDGAKINCQQIVLGKSPLTFESWLEDDEGARTTSPTYKRSCQTILDAAIAKANGSSWFGLF